MAIRLPNSSQSETGSIARVEPLKIDTRQEIQAQSDVVNEEPRTNTPTAFRGIPGVVVLQRPPKNAGLSERHSDLVDQGLDPNYAAQKVLDEGPAHLRVIKTAMKRSMRRVVLYSVAILLAYGVTDFTLYQTGFGQIGFLSLIQTKLGIPKIADYGKSYIASDLDSTAEFIKKYGDAQNTVIRICRNGEGLPSVSLQKRPGSGSKITANEQKDFMMLNELAITSPAGVVPAAGQEAAPSQDPLSACTNDLKAPPTTSVAPPTTVALEGR